MDLKKNNLPLNSFTPGAFFFRYDKSFSLLHAVSPPLSPTLQLFKHIPLHPFFASQSVALP